MYRVIIWGSGKAYFNAANIIASLARRGQIDVIGIVADSLPSRGYVDGYKIMSKLEAVQEDFDYVLLCVAKTAYDDALREAQEAYGIPRSKIIRGHVLHVPQFDFNDYVELRNSNVSIIAPLCWGGLACRTLDLQCLSPFRNMYIDRDSYIRVLKDLRRYCSIDELVFLRYDVDLRGVRHPVMALDDVELHFNHVQTPEEAQEEWSSRRGRINWGNLFVMNYCVNEKREAGFHALEQFEKRICLVSFPSEHPKSLYLHQRPSDTDFFDSVNATAMQGTGAYAVDLIRLLLGRSDYRRFVEPQELLPDAEAGCDSEAVCLRASTDNASEPLVSVVIPVYNVERWLPACLDSVLAQTLENIEVICVNDASPDGCAAILADYAARDARIRVFTLAENSGQGVARNVGLEHARGRYVYFLDSDDMVEPQALDELVQRADEDALDGIFFDSSVVYDTPALAKRNASYPASHLPGYPLGVVTGRELFEAFVLRRDWTCYVQRQFWRVSFLREYGIVFPKYSKHEDEQFAFEAIALAPRVAYVPKPYFIRRYREGSVMTSKAGIKNFASYFECFCKMVRFAHDHGLEGKACSTNAARIYAHMILLHGEMLAEGIDVLSTMEKTEYLTEYLFFAATQEAHLQYDTLSEETLDRARAASAVYVYGAGVLAGGVHENLALRDIAITGFMVTSMKNNPSVYKGCKVHALEDVPYDPDALVIIAVTDGFRAEIEDALDAIGWQHAYCKDGTCR